MFDCRSKSSPLCCSAETKKSLCSAHCTPFLILKLPVLFCFCLFFGIITVKEGVVCKVVWAWTHMEGADLTFQSDDLWAVEVQQGGQGAAVCVVLQQVFHQGERWSAPLLRMLPPVASLKPWQWHKDITYMCHRGGYYSRLDSLTPTHKQTGVNLRTFKLRVGFRLNSDNGG